MRYLNDDKHSINSKSYDRCKFNPKRLQKEDIQIAEELCYPRIVVDLLRKEPDQLKRQRILCDARNGKYDKK